MPMISVIVPVYKVEPYIHRCVDSILNQSFSDFDLILVDDGSPDSCGVICDEYAKKDSRIHVIHQENGGLSAARNAGIDWAFANSDSRWLTFIDSDDWIHRDYLRVLYHMAQSAQCQISLCDLQTMDHYLEDVDMEYPAPLLLNPEQAYIQYYSMCMTACCKLYRKDLFSELRFPVGKLHEDAFVTHRLIFGADRLAICDVKLYYYYENAQSITRVSWSERRLDQIEAHEQRLAWLWEQGFEKAAHREMEAYALVLFTQSAQLLELSKTDKKYWVYMKRLRKKLLRTMYQQRKEDFLSHDGGNRWIRETVVSAMLPWGVLCLIRRIKHSLH